MEDANEMLDAERAEAINKAGSNLLHELRARASAMLAEHQDIRLRFEAQLIERWGAAIDLLQTILVIAQEAGDAFNKKHRSQAVADNDFVFEVLTRLHARACLTTSEVLALLRSGHADGALSRWRTLHEIAAVAIFISKQGQDVAERYLLHEYIEAYRAAEEYQRHCARLGMEPFDETEMESFKKSFDKLQAKYGDAYPGKYGWASAAMRAADPSFRGRVTFENLEQAAGVNHLRPYYRMASHPIHASPKGIASSLRVMKTRKLLLAGPSNAGLSDPGHATCISLSQVTNALLILKPDFETVMAQDVIQQLVDEAGQSFITAHRALIADERNIQSQNNSPSKDDL